MNSFATMTTRFSWRWGLLFGTLIAIPACDCGGEVPGALNDADPSGIDAPDNPSIDAPVPDPNDGGIDAVTTVDSGMPAGKIVISELVAYPINDWNQTDGGGVPYTVPPGTGQASSIDQFIELQNWGPGAVNMTDWALEVVGSGSVFTTIGEDGVAVVSPGSSITELQPGDFLVIGNPAGSISSDAFVLLRDRFGNIIDDVEIGGLSEGRDREGDGVGDGAPAPDRNGFARGSYEESIARPDGTGDSDDDQADFVAMIATPLAPNIAPPPPVETVPPTVLDYSTGSSFQVTSLLRVELDEQVAPVSTDADGVVTVLADGEPIALGFTTFENDDRVIVINPVGRLPFDSDVSVTVRGGPGGVTDRAGNPLDSDLEFTVHTEPAASDPGAVVINEVCASPVQDWSTDMGGDGTPFSSVVGNGLVTPSDEWVELFVLTPGPVDLRGYELVVYNGPTYFGPARQSMPLASSSPVYVVTGTSTALSAAVQGTRVVIGNPDGVFRSSCYLALRDSAGQLVDTVEIGGVSEDTDRGGDGVDNGAPGPGQSGSSSGVDDETVARVPDGSDTGDDVLDFEHASATISISND